MLRELIRNIILENAQSNLTDKEIKGLEVFRQDDMRLKIESGNYDKTIKFYKHLGNDDFIYIARFSINRPGSEDEDYFHLGTCNHAWITTATWLQENYRKTGLGALLYGVTLEIAGDMGLASDREEVSKDAQRMWKYFKSNPLIKQRQLDIYNEFAEDEGNYFLTSWKTDDCAPWSAMNNTSFSKHDITDEDYLMYWGDPDFEREYKNSPLSKVYYKQNTPIYDILKGYMI